MRISDWSSDVCSSVLLVAPMGRSYNNRIGFLVAEIRQATGAFQQRHQRRACRGIERSPARANLRMALALIGERRLCVASAANLKRDQVGRASCRERVCAYV